jgi:hypothetical protein
LGELRHKRVTWVLAIDTQERCLSLRRKNLETKPENGVAGADANERAFYDSSGSLTKRPVRTKDRIRFQ